MDVLGAQGFWTVERLGNLAPWALGLVGCVLLFVRFWRFLPRRPQAHAVRRLASDTSGAAQSLDLVMVLPVLTILLLTIAQLGVLLNAQLVVAYASYAACRSAIVWLPSDADEGEKRRHIEQAAALACLPIGTRVDLNLQTGAALLGSALGGDVGLEAARQAGSPLAIYSDTIGALPSEEAAAEAWQARFEAAPAEALIVAAYFSARSGLVSGSPAPGAASGFGDFRGTGADRTAVLARRFSGAARKYMHARACTVAEWTSASGVDPVTVTVHHQLTLKVPYVGFFFDERPTDWIQSTPDTMYGDLVVRKQRNILTGQLFVDRPYIRTLSESFTLVHQGRIEGRGCDEE